MEDRHYRIDENRDTPLRYSLDRKELSEISKRICFVNLMWSNNLLAIYQAMDEDREMMGWYKKEE